MTGNPDDDTREVGGRYRLLRSLGRGGMGVVWAAHDRLLDREVAVKEVTYPVSLDGPQSALLRERTLREARAAARINSVAAVTVYDVVEEDGRPWIVMELLPGRSLADVLREQGPLSREDAARVGLRLVDALGAAHAAGVMHRDVKPANVLYDRSGQAVLTDFGIASLEGDSSLTTTGAVIGSPGYVAPERAHGRPPSPASDLWSLGVTLATALHGRSPFERDTALATMVAAIQEPLPAQVGEGPLGAVISRLLHKDPAQRPDVVETRALLDAELADPTAGNGTAATSVLPAALLGPPAVDPGGSPLDERTQALPRPDRVAGAPAAAAASRGPLAPPAQARPAAPRPTAPRAVAPRPPATRPSVDAEPRRSRTLPVLLAVVALVVAGMVLAVALDRSGEDELAGVAPGATTEPSSTVDDPAETAAAEAPADEAPAEEAPAEEAPAEEAPVEEAPAEVEPSPVAPAPPAEPQDDGNGNGNGNGNGGGGPDAGSDAVTPDGYRVHEDPAYRVAVPEGWVVEPDGDTRTRFADPNSRRYLLVEEGGEPAGDPVEDWQAQEGAVADRLDGYERISIEAADYRDFDAADWQFTWEPSGGTLRVLNRAVVDDDQAFALYWSVPEEEWDDSLPVLDDIAASFQPAG